ncbi:MAG: glycosyltransferase family 4 protein [Rhodothermales bacterium]
MRLLIVSHTPHYEENDGFKGWGPTIREISYLARLFDEVVHVAPLFKEIAPASALPYESSNIRVRPVSPTGGSSFLDKVTILRAYPSYARVIREEMKKADIVHVRCPANISLLALFLLSMVHQPVKRWFKYAGNWRPTKGEPWSYTLQRWWLRKDIARGLVTVNGVWSDQPDHVHSFLNPCLSEDEIGTPEALKKNITSPVRLLYVGRLEQSKGVGRALQVLARLDALEVTATLDLVGDGPERKDMEQLASALGVERNVRFQGWVARTELTPYYMGAHIFLFPSEASEGWPKVLSEAMAYGTVPLTSTVSSIPQYIHQFGAGQTFEACDIDAYARTIANYVKYPQEWQKASRNAARAAEMFTFPAYLRNVHQLLRLSDNALKSEFGGPLRNSTQTVQPHVR